MKEFRIETEFSIKLRDFLLSEEIFIIVSSANRNILHFMLETDSLESATIEGSIIAEDFNVEFLGVEQIED